jgi:hypothetical protein
MSEPTKPKRKILRWRRQPRESGLAGTAQGERGWHLMYGDDRVGTVGPLYEGFSRNRKGYYYYASDRTRGVPSINTAGHPPFPDADAAKAACREYVEAHLKREGT